MRGAGKPAVMDDVALLAQVSAQTVSRVINGHPHVKPETRARVLAAIRALRYQPNAAARTLVTQRSRMIGLVTFGTTPVTLLYAMEGAANPAGYQVGIVGCPRTDEPSIRAALARLHEQAVEGILLVSPAAAAWRVLHEAAPQVPAVVAGVGPGEGFPTVAVDNALGARLATRHLLDLGHHTVHHLRGPADDPEAEERCAGWQATLEAAGRPVPAPIPGDASARSGYAAGLRLAADPTVTAIFCGTDHMAVGVLRALSEAGRHVPRDVSVVGFGDVPEAAYLRPPLTSVWQDLAAVGRDSVALLLAQIDSRAREPVRRRCPPRLIVRGSTAAP